VKFYEGEISENFNDASGDVIATKALRSGDVSCAAVVDDAADTILEFLHGGLLAASSVDLVVAPGDGFLGSHAVPKTVTGQKDKLARAVNWDDLHVGEGGHGLVSRLHGGVSLILEVTEGTGESEGSVNTAVFDESVGVVDALAFFNIIGLVILGELEGNFTFTEDSAGVSSIGAVNFGGGHNNGGGGAAGVGLVGAIVELGDLLLALGGEHHLVHLVEHFLKGLVVLLGLESLKLDQLRHQMFFHIEGYFLATMTVKNSEEADTASKIFLSDVRVLHRASPPLHADSAESELVVFSCLNLLLSVRFG